MKKSTLFLNIGTIIISLTALTFSLVLYINRPKIIVVDNKKLLSGFIPVKENQILIEKEIAKYQTEIDSLENKSIYLKQKMKDKTDKMTIKDELSLKKNIEELEMRANNYRKYVEGVINEKQSKMNKAVINQVNEFINQCGKESAYDVILGSTDLGNLLFAKEKFDKTDEILNKLNQKYSGK